MATTACHSPSSGAQANSAPFSSHVWNNARASSPSVASGEPSLTPVSAPYSTRCTAVLFYLGRFPRRVSMKATWRRHLLFAAPSSCFTTTWTEKR